MVCISANWTQPSPRKEDKSDNEMSGKQEGLSNTDTHHSSQVSKQDDKSKKGEGTPETAKSMGTVDPNRPMAESDDRGKRQ